MKLKILRQLTPDEFKDFLALIEMEYTIKSVQIPNNIDAEILDINTYINQRMEERKRKPEILWPATLSKKEMIICKIAMIEKLVRTSSFVHADPIINFSELIKDIKSEIYSSYVEVTKGTKSWKEFPGLRPEVAALLNTIYKVFYKIYYHELNYGLV